MTSFNVALVAEDELSMAVMERIVAASDRQFVVTRRLVERGFGNIRKSIPKYRNASHVVPHIVLTDLDNGECPHALRIEWGALELPDRMLFRVAVRETESWLLGDRSGFAQFASIDKKKITQTPEGLADPKETLINLVRASRSKRLASELVPEAGSAARVGPLYGKRLVSFVNESWSIDEATAACPSLQRMRQRLAAFLTDL